MKLIKILLILLVTVIISNLYMQTTSYALGVDDFIEQGDRFLSKADTISVINEGALQATSNTIYNILFAIALVIAMAVGIIIGIQFVTGSVDEKAKIKETLVPYVVGVAVVFSTFTIWKITIEIGQDIVPTKIQIGQDSTVNETILLYENLKEGEITPDDLNDSELKAVFNSYVGKKVTATHDYGDPIQDAINGDIGYLLPSLPEQVSTVEENIQKLDATDKKIYDECIERELLNAEGTALK